jgi:ligand-binding sensor domain-containing protein
MEIKIKSPQRPLVWLLSLFLISSCQSQVKEKSESERVEVTTKNQRIWGFQETTFPQIHSNLHGMVREFVRSMYQDKKGNYWFGTNTDGIIRYDGKTLENMDIGQGEKGVSVREIVEDKWGSIWFATSAGLMKFDGSKFETFSVEVGLNDPEIWSLYIDRNEQMWVSTSGGVSHFDGKKFVPFLMPTTMVDDPQHMLSDKLVMQFLEDKHGVMWMAMDGNGIFKYANGEFVHLTTKNGLTDNNVASLMEDKQGNMWIGTFYGGASKFDGTHFTNYTKEGIIEGVETGGFFADNKGYVWFTAENIGVYQYDGEKFRLYTTKDGLTSNVVLSILQDNKDQLWFGTWQGLCILDGDTFVNASDKESWTK